MSGRAGLACRIGATVVALLAPTIATMLAPGCALVQDLDGSKYSAVDEGGHDAGCPFEMGCLPKMCFSQAECDGGVCAVTATFVGLATVSCMSMEDLKGSPLAFQLCASTSECVNGKVCATNYCALAGDAAKAVSLNACGALPGPTCRQ